MPEAERDRTEHEERTFPEVDITYPHETHADLVRNLQPKIDQATLALAMFMRDIAKIGQLAGPRVDEVLRDIRNEAQTNVRAATSQVAAALAGLQKSVNGLEFAHAQRTIPDLEQLFARAKYMDKFLEAYVRAVEVQKGRAGDIEEFLGKRFQAFRKKKYGPKPSKKKGAKRK